MIPNSILLATLTSLLTFASAAPVSRAETTSQGRPIKWTRQDGQELCLQINPTMGGLKDQLFNGAHVGIGLECFPEGGDFFPLQQWIYQTGSTTICLAPNDLTDTEYCIDFDSNLGANGQQLKIWQRYEGLAAQQLYITEDNHIAVENGPGQCADVQQDSVTRPPRGSLPYGSFKDLQSWECSSGNANQIFGFDASAAPAPSPSPPHADAQGRPIKWLRESDGAELCLQVNAFTGTLEQQLRNGAPVGSNKCFPEDSDYAPFQRWVYKAGSTKICVAPNRYSNTEYCIDFNSNLGSNGQQLKIWQAQRGLPAQQLYITDDNHIAVENGPGQCVDVRAESGPQPDYARPYGSQKDVQTWECFGGSSNQIFRFTF
ncbi:hypothetical protein QFC20_003663 [Naganishia adeliensis]|uniref:Uncharacterized protein n=1 Tax=Naganishia adeliensis TaxID=92952 RepID=A0ACC2W8B4_9TREE|nr:hypothetical protein QFC20_003663 [Naganishia adeliensis]